MDKGTDHFKKTIEAKLQQMAQNDWLFAKALQKETKTLDGCINYILNQVKDIGATGYTDSEIFGMAAHYYDQDDLEECSPIDVGIVVNHKPELSSEEKDELKKQVRNEMMEKERQRLQSSKPKPKVEPQSDPSSETSTIQQSSLF